MFNLVASALLSLLKGYVAKLATKEFAHYVFMQLAEALVKSTKTPHDDAFLAKIKEIIEREGL